jgi:membrane protease YdiL (CAAX protease family)
MMTLLQPILDAFRGPQRKPTVILLTTSVLLLVWKYYGAPEFLAAKFVNLAGDAQVAGAIGHFLSCFVLLGVLPALVVKLLFRERLRDYGVGLGIPVRTARTLALLAPFFVLGAYVASKDPQILVKFPINPQAGSSPSMFAWHAATYALFYAGWEFYFRGFLLFGLRDSLGAANAVLIQTAASALLHIGSPASETFGAILGGLLWGVLALQTRSLLSGLAQHYLLGIALDAFICYE